MRKSTEFLTFEDPSKTLLRSLSPNPEVIWLHDVTFRPQHQESMGNC